MPRLTIDDLDCYYRLEGRDDRPVVILSHSLGQDHAMWDPQAVAFADHFRVLRYDTRGHGATRATPGDYTIERLGRDVLALADALGIERFAFCGCSLGGMIGLWLALNARDRLTAVVLANTSARPDAAKMEERRRTVLSTGMGSVADGVMSRFFLPESIASGAPLVAEARRVLRSTDPVGYAGCCAAIRDFDLSSRLEEVAVPTLVVSGDRDTSLPWEGHNQPLAERIPGARVLRVPTAHLSNLEAPRAFNGAVFDLLLPQPTDRLAAGMMVRRSVLGDAHVDRAVASTTELNRAFQELITQYAWGTIWTRPGLDVRTRRLLVLATTAALGRLEEFRLHVRTGLAHELEWRDLEEVLLQVAIYAGMPAANTAFHAALEERAAAGQSR